MTRSRSAVLAEPGVARVNAVRSWHWPPLTLVALARGRIGRRRVNPQNPPDNERRVIDRSVKDATGMPLVSAPSSCCDTRPPVLSAWSARTRAVAFVFGDLRTASTTCGEPLRLCGRPPGDPSCRRKSRCTSC